MGGGSANAGNPSGKVSAVIAAEERLRQVKQTVIYRVLQVIGHPAGHTIAIQIPDHGERNVSDHERQHYHTQLNQITDLSHGNIVIVDHSVKRGKKNTDQRAKDYQNDIGHQVPGPDAFSAESKDILFCQRFQRKCPANRICPGRNLLCQFRVQGADTAVRGAEQLVAPCFIRHTGNHFLVQHTHQSAAVPGKPVCLQDNISAYKMRGSRDFVNIGIFAAACLKFIRRH